MKKRKAKQQSESLPSPEGSVVPHFWDAPPPMSDAAQEVFNRLKQRIPEPKKYGIEEEDIYDLVSYCELQAWLLQRPFAHINDTQEQEYGGTKNPRIRNTINPELDAWLKVNRTCQAMAYHLFKRKHRNYHPPVIPPPDPGPQDDPEILKAEDFPLSIRDSAKEAAKLLQGKDISKTMPFALKIGGKAPILRG